MFAHLSPTRSERCLRLRPLRLALWMASLFLALGSLGCDAFQPRTPPPPCDPLTDPGCAPPPDFFDPLTPEIVRDNIERALEGRTVEPNYRRSLQGPPDDEEGGVFTYGPDPGAEAGAPPGFFDGWNKDREVQFMLTLLEGSASTNLRSVSLDFDRYDVDPDFPATTNLKRYDVEYDLILTYLDGDPPEERTERYGGRAKWDLIGGDRNFWTLLTWEDIAPLEDPDDPFFGTMGTLRALVGP